MPSKRTIDALLGSCWAWDDDDDDDLEPRATEREPESSLDDHHAAHARRA